MPLYTKEEIKAKIEALDAKITKAEDSQSYNAGANISLSRGDLRAMYSERERLVKEYDRLERLETATTSGAAHLVQFEGVR